MAGSGKSKGKAQASGAHTPSWEKPETTATTKPRSEQHNVGLLAPKPKSPDQPRSWLGERTVRNSWDTVPERDAVRVVEELFGSLEEFGAWCVFDVPEMLDPDVSLPKKAELSGVPIGALGCLLGRSVKFRGVLRGALANQVFDVMAEVEHLRVVAGIAANQGKTVLTKSGAVATVDNSERGVMDAGEYLNRYRGTPLGGVSGTGGATLVLNFQGAPESGSESELEARTVTVAGKPVGIHSPLRAGALPPEGVRTRYAQADGQTQGHASASSPQDPAFGRSASGVMGSDLDFQGESASGAPDYFGRSAASGGVSGQRERDERGREAGNQPSGANREARSFRQRLDGALSGRNGGIPGYGAGASQAGEGLGEGFAAPERGNQPGSAGREPQKPS